MTTNISKGLMLQSKKTENEKFYWINKLSGELVKTYFPYDYIAPDAPTYKKDNFHFRIPDDLFPKLMQLAKGSDNNLYIVLMTCLAILLSKYTGNKDIIVATPIYKQESDGEFINTSLAIRLQLTGEESVKDLIILCKNTVFEANEHLNFPIERFVNDLRLTLPGDGYSFFETGILLENIHYKKYIEHLHPTILFSFLKAEANIEGVLEYNPLLYKKGTIDKIVSRFNALLHEIINNPNLRILGIEILSEEERYRLLTNFNQTQTDYPKHKAIHELFEEQVENRGENIAVVGEGYTGSLGYRELNERANRLGRILRERGVKVDSIVAISVLPSIQTIIAILAVLKAGAAYLPIDPDFPEERINFMLKDSQTHLLLSSIPSNKQLVTGCKSINIYDESMNFGDGSNMRGIHAPGDVIYAIYTSGTSGRPKGVLIKNENLVNYISWFSKKVGLTENDKAMLISSFAFDLGYTSIYPSILAGGELHIMPKETFLVPDSLLEYLERNGITYMKLTPSLFSIIVNSANFSKKKLLSLKLVVLGGEPINTNDVEQARLLCDHVQIMNHYGPTETTIGVIARFIDFDRFDEYKLNPDIGKPIDNTEIYILDENFKPVPIGIAAELYIGGSGVGIGYLNKPELTSHKFVIHPFRGDGRLYKTGDMAKWTPDGNIGFLGRIDYQVKIRGFRVELEEIENQLLKYDVIQNALVIDKDDRNGGKYLCAYYVSSEEIETNLLRDYLSSKLPHYMIPSFFVRIERIPVTPNGKIDRRVLPELEMNKDIDYIPPQNNHQEKMVNLWSKVLGVAEENISIDANFFELGGDSLKATKLIAKIHKEFCTQVPLLELFKAPTVREISEILSGAKVEKYASIEPVEEKEYYLLSSAQKRIYLLHQLTNESIVYNLPIALILEGNVDLDKLNNAFKNLINRHEGLRTSFEIVNELPVQRVHKTVEFAIECFEAMSGSRKAEEIIRNFVRPFDLSSAPLVRAGLIKTGEMKYMFIVDMHHIIRDGQSEKILNREFIELYTGEEFPPLKLQYKDYSEWLNSHRMQETIYLQEKYWKQEFWEEIPVLNLPIDYPRSVNQSFEGSKIDFELTEEETVTLNKIANSEGVTTFMILLALFDVFLSRISGQEEIIVGTPIAARNHADLEKIIGMFVNTLTLKNFTSFNSMFNDFLNTVREKTIAAFDNQNYPFEKLVETISVERDISRNPIFDVMFLLQNLSEAEENTYLKRGNDFSIQTYAFENKTSKFDLTLKSLIGDKNIFFQFEYCSKLFKTESIQRFIKYFKKIVSGVLANPRERISDIEIIPEEEKKQVLYDFNNTESAYPKEKNLHRYFEETVEMLPDDVAVVGSSLEGEIHLTYKELNKKSNQLSHILKKRGGQHDTIVGIAIPRSIEMIIGLFGILKMGGGYLPIDPNYPEERISFILKDSSSNILIDTVFFENDMKLDRWEGTDSVLNSSTDSSSAYVIYTSGTTGKPKGVLIERHSVVNRLNWMQQNYPLEKCDVILQKTTFTFDVSVWELFWWSFGGARLCLLGIGDEKDPSAIVKSIQYNHISTIHFVPSMMNVFLDYLENLKESDRCASIRYVFSSGEALGSYQVERFYDLLQTESNPGIRLINLYGPTEATVDVSFYDCIAGDLNKSVPIGKPIHNICLYILNKYMKLQPINIAGELFIAGVGLARGYLNHPELTAEKFSDLTLSSNEVTRVYHTGDLSRWLPSGNVDFLGRIDHQVKIRGFRIELSEIEFRLSNHPGIKESVVLMREDENKDKYLCAYIVSDREYDISELYEYVIQVLPDYMAPSYFVRIERIPITSNGKLNRKALPAPELQLGKEYMTAQNEVEEKLVEMWKDVLNISPASDVKIGIYDNFFHLGGHSLKATTLISRISKQFNVQIPLGEIFKTPTINGLAEYLQKAVRSKFFSIEISEKKAYYELSPAQKRLYILQQLEINSAAYNMPHVLSFEESILEDKLEEALRKLIYRHESLRTSFELVDGAPVQKVHDHVDFEIESYDLIVEKTINPEEIINRFTRPFDLSKAPLLRAGLIKEEAKYTLIIDLHHIITDGISQDLLVRDFRALYTVKELLPLRIQYKEYSEWQLSAAVQDMLKKQEEYWLREFEEQIPILNLPTDYPRPHIKSFEGSYVDFEINVEDTRFINKLTYNTGATLFMVILAIYNILLAKLCNQEDIVVGTPIAGRRHPDLEKIVGMFVNTLALRNFPSGEKTFIKFLKEVIEKAIKVFENQDYPFEDIVEKIDIKKDMSRNPLFDVMFGVQNFNNAAGSDGIVEKVTGDLKIRLNPHKRKTSKFDFSLEAIEMNDKLYFRITYCTKLFREDSIVRFINYFKKIITLVSKKPEIEIFDIAMISEEEKKYILYTLNNTEVEYPKNMTIHYLFEQQVEKNPDKIAAVYKRQEYNYGELNKKANQLASLLISKGIGRGAFVPAPIDHSMELLISFLAILKVGAAFVPLDVHWPIERVKVVLDDLGGEIVLVNEFTPWTGDDMNRKTIMVSLHLMQGNENNPHVYSDRETPVYVMYTSGSTGKPKGVIIPRRGVINRLYWMNDYFGPGASKSVLQTTRYVYDSVVWQFFWPLMNGGRTVILPPDFIMRADSLTHMVETHRISIVDFVPSIFNTVVDNMVENPQLKEKLISLKDIILGGEEIIPTAVYKFMKIFPQIRITNLYGPTETTIGCVYHQVIGCEGDKIPIGKPISNVKIFVMDKYKNLMPVGLPGEIYIAGIGLGLGYLDNVEKTDSVFQKNPFTPGERMYRTGDVGRWSEEEKIDFFGRIDFQVKIRGYRIELGEIESQLLKYEDIKEAIVLCREESGIDKYLCAYIVSDKKISILELKEYLLKHLPTYLIPLYFIQIDKTPLTSSGKIDRNALNSIKLDIKTCVEYVAPKSEVEKKIADIWKEVLRLNDVGIFDNFFELGGNSLNIVIVNNKIKKVFEKDIPIVKMFTYPTIKSLANYISQEETNNIVYSSEIKDSVNMMEEAMQMLIGDENE